MSPLDNLKVNINKIREMFNQYGYVQGSFTRIDEDSDSKTFGQITGHCLMGALGHAYEIGNSDIFDIGIDQILAIEDTEKREAIITDMLDIAQATKDATNNWHKEQSKDYNVSNVPVNKTTAAEFIMTYNDTIAGAVFTLPISHPHYPQEFPHLKKKQTVWLGAKTLKGTGTKTHEWDMLKNLKRFYANNNNWANIKYNSDDCVVECAQWVHDSDIALQDIYSVLDAAEQIQRDRAETKVAEPVLS